MVYSTNVMVRGNYPGKGLSLRTSVHTHNHK